MASVNFATLIVPFNTLGAFAVIFYIAIFAMLAVGITRSVLEKEKGSPAIISSAKAPLFVISAAFVFSLTVYWWFGLHIMWALLFLTAILAQHKVFAKAMRQVKTTDEPLTETGFKLYLSVRKLSGTKHENPIDSVVAYAIVGIALVIQLMLVITFIAFLIINFAEIRSVIDSLLNQSVYL